MSTTTVNSTTFLSDTIKFLRDKLLENINDPLTGKRPASENFVLTEYPRNPVRYPIITLTDIGSTQEARLGMRSEGTAIRIGVEIRIWARNVIERDNLFNEIYTWLRTNQYDDNDDTNDANLHDFNMSSTTNVSEENVKSKLMEINYLFLSE